MSEILGLTLAGATAAARALLLVIQTCHWQTSGDSFYGDHKLFELIYDETIEDIDRLGEKAVAMSDELSVDVISQFEGMGSFLQKMTNPGLGIPTPKDLLHLALKSENLFLNWLANSIEDLEASGELSPGVENLLSELSDRHEKHVYLLQQALR